ncbi:MAG: 1-acyl-sn-glycerol-3-phosphate acyltransferase [Spirochaetales bacterium]|nr:1-acyl-sn-glycerol-3-phosphate acyltransferase [Spirochaetales bacterium]
MKQKDKKKRFYSPLLHIPAKIVFWLTLFFVILYDIFIARIRISGRRNLHVHTAGAFLISNHTHYLDPGIIAHAIAPRRTYFTAMEKTFLIPVVGTYIRYLGAFPVSEDMPYNNFVTNIEKIFKKGCFVHFFPEGELTHLNTGIGEFKHGVFFLAFRFNRPVIPVRIITKPYPCFSRTLNRFLCKVKVIIGKPVYPSQFKIKNRSLTEWIRLMSEYCRNMMR